MRLGGTAQPGRRAAESPAGERSRRRRARRRGADLQSRGRPTRGRARPKNAQSALTGWLSGQPKTPARWPSDPAQVRPRWTRRARHRATGMGAAAGRLGDTAQAPRRRQQQPGATAAAPGWGAPARRDVAEQGDRLDLNGRERRGSGRARGTSQPWRRRSSRSRRFARSWSSRLRSLSNSSRRASKRRR